MSRPAHSERGRLRHRFPNVFRGTFPHAPWVRAERGPQFRSRPHKGDHCCGVSESARGAQDTAFARSLCGPLVARRGADVRVSYPFLPPRLLCPLTFALRVPEQGDRAADARGAAEGHQRTVHGESCSPAPSAWGLGGPGSGSGQSRTCSCTPVRLVCPALGGLRSCMRHPQTHSIGPWPRGGPSRGSLRGRTWF